VPGIAHGVGSFSDGPCPAIGNPVTRCVAWPRPKRPTSGPSSHATGGAGYAGATSGVTSTGLPSQPTTIARNTASRSTARNLARPDRDKLRSAVEQHKNLLLPELAPWPSDRPAIELIDVTVRFGDKLVLDGLNLQILPQLTTVIVGRSGSGKSVLLKLMMGLLKPTSGKVILFGRDLSQVSDVEILELRKRMGMLFQNYALFDALTVEENVGFTLTENSKLPKIDVIKLSRELIRVLGLSGNERALPSDLSGGMKKRVSLARALVANPEVVLFDEPTTGLDPVMIEKVDEMIVLAKEQYRITSCIISHDMASTKRLADRVGFLHEGKIIFMGSYDELLASQLPPIKMFVDGAQTSRGVSGVIASGEAQPITDAPVVELVNVYKSFGGKHVLKGVDLAIYPKRTTVLIGASGSGKSVIIKHIMGLFKPDSGEIRVFGKDIVPMHDLELNEVRTHFGLLFQHAALLDWLNVFDNVAFPIRERTKASGEEVRRRVGEILERLNISDIANRMPGEISEGQKKRVGLARAIVMKPDIMIYDEPTTGQDPLRTRDIDNMIEETQKQFDITSIVISHDMASTFRIAHMIAMLYQGEIAAYGTPAQIRASTNPQVQHFISAGTVDA
jgi:ABC-type transporter Mla maintaining outer membrane lipid asymmetry ATPase subunit MlaF